MGSYYLGGESGLSLSLSRPSFVLSAACRVRRYTFVPIHLQMQEKNYLPSKGRPDEGEVITGEMGDWRILSLVF